MAPRVDSVLLVVDAGRSRRSLVRTAVQRVAGVGAHLAGTVMNRVDVAAGAYDYYAATYMMESRRQSRHRARAQVEATKN
jgi:Mrp family chromosome partitioning ATPase